MPSTYEPRAKPQPKPKMKKKKTKLRRFPKQKPQKTNMAVDE